MDIMNKGKIHQKFIFLDSRQTKTNLISFVQLAWKEIAKKYCIYIRHYITIIKPQQIEHQELKSVSKKQRTRMTFY